MRLGKRILEQLALGHPVQPVSVRSSFAITHILSRIRRITVWLGGPSLVAVAYFAGAEAAFYIGTLSDQIFALFWPPNVVLFCALVVVPQRDWWLYIAAAFPAHAIAEFGVGMPLPQLLVAFATNCAIALLNAYAVRRLVGEPPWFGNFRKAALYIVIAAGASPAICAFGGALVPIMGGKPFDEYWTFYVHWYLANVLPNLTLGPVFLIWFSDRSGLRDWKPSRRHMEHFVVAVALVGLCWLTAATAERLPANSLLPAVLLLPLPLVLWAAVRFGEKGASSAILVVAVILTWRTLHGAGLFPSEGAERSVLAVQLFLTGLSIPVLLLGALIDETQRAEQTRRELAARVVRAQEEERRRIARDLHDSTGQNLIAATLIAGRIENSLPQAARAAFQRLEEILQQSIRELRTVSYLLHPPLLDDAGLGLALRNFVDGFVERTGIAVDVELSPNIDRLPSEIELVLFRVVQEALANVARHSQSKTAMIRLDHEETAEGTAAVLVIEDAGKGMPDFREPYRSTPISSRSKAPGVGLASMRERLHQIGGRLDIESSKGQTILRAIAPIRVRPIV